MEDRDIFKCLQIINETNIEYKLRNGKDYKMDSIIREMLKDEKLFFKISKEKAYEILKKIGVENIDTIYNELTNICHGQFDKSDDFENR